MMRRGLAALLVGALLLCSGCWEYRSISSLALALGIALDADEEEGLLVTLSFALPGQMKGAGGPAMGGPDGGQLGAFFRVEGRGPTFPEALADAQHSMSRRMSFGHLQVVLVGEQLARDGAGELFEQLLRFAELDKLSDLLVVREGQAADALMAVPAPERMPARFLHTAMETRGQTSLSRPSTLLQWLVLEREAGRDFLSAVVNVSGNQLVIDRLAVFRHAELVAILSPEESRAVLIAQGELRNDSLSLPRPEGGRWVFRRLDANGTRLALTTRQGRPLLRIAVKVIGEVGGAGGGALTVTAAELAAMERALAGHLSGEIQAAMERLQALEVEPLGFFARQNPDLSSDDAWRNFYARSRFDVSVTVQLHRKGVLK
jgi:spore germination protein KC